MHQRKGLAPQVSSLTTELKPVPHLEVGVGADAITGDLPPGCFFRSLCRWISQQADGAHILTFFQNVGIQKTMVPMPFEFYELGGPKFSSCPTCQIVTYLLAFKKLPEGVWRQVQHLCKAGHQCLSQEILSLIKILSPNWSKPAHGSTKNRSQMATT